MMNGVRTQTRLFGIGGEPKRKQDSGKKTRGKDRVRIIRLAGFTGYDLSLDSKVRKPDRYGIQLVPLARAAINSTTQRPEHRTKDGKITLRVTAPQKQLLIRAQERGGYPSLQAYLDEQAILPLLQALTDAEQAE